MREAHGQFDVWRPTAAPRTVPPGAVADGSGGLMLAVITGHAALGGATDRYEYSWVRMAVSGNALVTDTVSPASGTAGGANAALHLLEFNNTATFWGNQSDPTNPSPASALTLTPLLDGTPVLLWRVLDVAGAVRYLIVCPPNGLGITC